MIQFIYGRSGSGKSYRIDETIKALLRDGKNVILLCPEQEAVLAEGRLTKKLSDAHIPSERLEILNFGRLPERIFRIYGGLTQTVLGEGGRRLLMHRALCEVQPFLHCFGTAVTDSAMIDRLLAAVTECKMFCIGAEALGEAAKTLADTNTDSYRRLRDKVSDLSLVYAVYERYLHTAFTDPQDQLAALETVLSCDGGAFFADKYVYIDGFHGFTEQQYRILSHIFEKSLSVTVSVGFEIGDEREPMMRKIADTEKRLTRLAANTGKEVKKTVLRENRRTDNAALQWLNRKLWQFADRETVAAGDAVRVFAGATPFEEAESVAKDIRRRILGGAHYRDFTVVLRDVSKYEGILDIMLDRYGIPYYMAKRSSLKAKPLFRYLHSLFAVALYRFRRADVLTLLKTGLTGISDDDIFLFENYVSAWNLSGRRFTEENDWNMNPAGSFAAVTEDGIAALARINAVKRTLCDRLTPFVASVTDTGEDMTVRAYAELLFSHLWDADMPAMLARDAAQARYFGEITEAEELSRVWDIFVSVLDTLVSVGGDEICSLQGFRELLDLLLDGTDIGTIPARTDEVTIGDASRLRQEATEHVYLMGATDGVFPKAPGEDALFSDYEKTVLDGIGTRLSPVSGAEMQDELFCFWYAAVSARRSVTVTYPAADLSGKAYHPSIGVNRLLALFSDLHITTVQGEQPPDAVLARGASSFAVMAECRHTDGYHALADALADYYERERSAVSDGWLAALHTPLVVRRNRLDEKTTAELFGRTVSMSQSRLEEYVLCHFAYFCGYVLKLQEQKRASFGAADIGNFVHYVLERFFVMYGDAPDKTIYEDDGLLRDTVSALISDYLCTIRDTLIGAGQEKRVTHLFRRLLAATTVVIKNLMAEFSESDFVPRAFELPIGEDDGKSLPALKIRTEDGTSVLLRGKADRVDFYELDGKNYFRIVDYKTFVKKFSEEDVAKGLNMQMLLYLFAIWKNGNSRFDGELTPAGILYMASAPSETVQNTIPDAEKAEADAEKSLARSGLFLDDRAVLAAMEHGLAGKYIPVKIKKDGSYTASSPVVSLDRFGELMREVEKTVCELVTDMKGGNADALPLSKRSPETGRDPCSHCAMKPVCRASFAGKG